jgi:hypothetical protein
MQLTKTYTFSHELKPSPTGSATTGIKSQATPHKYVTAYASLSKVSHHSNNPPSAAAFVGFDDYVQGDRAMNAGGAVGDRVGDPVWRRAYQTGP